MHGLGTLIALLLVECIIGVPEQRTGRRFGLDGFEKCVDGAQALLSLSEHHDQVNAFVLHHGKQSHVKATSRELSFLTPQQLRPLQTMHLPYRVRYSSLWSDRDVAVFGEETTLEVQFDDGASLNVVEHQDVDGKRVLTSFLPNHGNYSSSPSSQRRFSVCTYNLWHYTDVYALRLPRINQHLQHCDIALLQEVRLVHKV
jgi:hypothetical protein